MRLPWSVIFLLAYLAAITVIGKGPTYIGIPPLFWGEAVMVAGVLFIAPWVIGTGSVSRKSTLAVLIVAWMGLGAVQTMVSFPRWGIDAIRDAAMWYYGIFFFVGLGLASRKAVADRVWWLLRVFWLFALIWNTANLLSKARLQTLGPVIPWRGVPLLFNSTHEAGQNLALGAILVLCTDMLKKRPLLRVLMTMIAILGLAVFAASQARGMRVGIAAGGLVVLLFSFAPRMPQLTSRLFVVAVLSVPLVVLAVLVDTQRFVKLTNVDRFEQTDQGTAAWRVVWWQRLYDQVMKRNPVFGIGFGESLAVYHPLLASLQEEFLVRSPHNFNVTVFTRMGIAGLLLWLAIVAVGIGELFVSVWRGMDRAGPYTTERRDELTFWILMLVCSVVNSSFGVLMEGPVMAIWFWLALGFASSRALSSGREGAEIHYQRGRRLPLRPQFSTPQPDAICWIRE
jgi:O-antigen ligase